MRHLGEVQIKGAKLAGNASLWTDGALVQNANFGTSGFSALPGGYRSFSDGSFNYLGNCGNWWSEYGDAVQRRMGPFLVLQ